MISHICVYVYCIYSVPTIYIYLYGIVGIYMYSTYICTIRRYCNSTPYYTYYIPHTPHTHHIYSIPTSATIMNMNAHENALYVLYKHLSSEPLLEWTYSLNAMVMSMKVCICVCVCDWMCVHVYVYMYIYVCVI